MGGVAPFFKVQLGRFLFYFNLEYYVSFYFINSIANLLRVLLIYVVVGSLFIVVTVIGANRYFQ